MKRYTSGDEFDISGDEGDGPGDLTVEVVQWHSWPKLLIKVDGYLDREMIVWLYEHVFDEDTIGQTPGADERAFYVTDD